MILHRSGIARQPCKLIDDGVGEEALGIGP